MRIGFVGETGWEIHFPAESGPDLWKALLEAGRKFEIRPFGIEAQRLLRLEKRHVIVGVDSDALTNPFEAGMAWAPKLDKEDFIGRAALKRLAGQQPQPETRGLYHERRSFAGGRRGNPGKRPTGRKSYQCSVLSPQTKGDRPGVGAGGDGPRGSRSRCASGRTPGARQDHGAGVLRSGRCTPAHVRGIPSDGRSLGVRQRRSAIAGEMGGGAALALACDGLLRAKIVRGNPIKQTALFHTHRESGATMIEHHGWHVPSSFTAPDDEAARTRESVGLADVSWMSKFDLQGHGLKTPPALGPEAFLWALGRLHCLVTCEPPAGRCGKRAPPTISECRDGSFFTSANLCDRGDFGLRTVVACRASQP